jgi:hypothetical protein
MKLTVSIRIQNSKFTALTPLSNGYNVMLILPPLPRDKWCRNWNTKYQYLTAVSETLHYPITHHAQQKTSTQTSNNKQPHITHILTLHNHDTNCSTSCNAKCLPQYVRTVPPTQNKLFFRIWYSSFAYLPCVALLFLTKLQNVRNKMPIIV